MGLGRSERPIHRMSRLVPALVRGERAHAVRVVTCHIPFFDFECAPSLVAFQLLRSWNIPLATSFRNCLSRDSSGIRRSNFAFSRANSFIFFHSSH